MPSNFISNSVNVPLNKFLIEVCLSNKASVNKKSFQDTIFKIANEFRIKFISKFKSGSKTVETIKENATIDPFMSKLSSFRTELSLIEHKIVSLEIRKSQIQSQNQIDIDLEENLLSNHELIESSLFACIESELTQSYSHQTIFQSLNYVIFQYLNDNLQKWILMENASLAAKDDLFGLTSIEGDWFLEEMLSLISNCNHLTQLLKKTTNKYNVIDYVKTSMPLEKCIDASESLSSIFGEMKNLLFSYQIDLSQEMLRLTFLNVNDAYSTIDEFKAMNLELFFSLISNEEFNIENFHKVNF